MFTGIVEEVGRIRSTEVFGRGSRLTIEAPRCTPELSIGDSIAINGVCLTTVSLHGDAFLVEAVEETLHKTNLGQLHEGSRINLERPLRVGDRLGGHYVLGHVDETAIITRVEKREESWWFGVQLPEASRSLIIPRGSVCIDGVSLTVAEKESDTYFISIIPYTFEHTIFHSYKEGSTVNVEYDVIGKYALNLLNT